MQAGARRPLGAEEGWARPPPQLPAAPLRRLAGSLRRRRLRAVAVLRVSWRRVGSCSITISVLIIARVGFVLSTVQ